MTHPTPEQAKIKALEGLRGVMAWWVVLGHLSHAVGWHLPLIDRNTLAVDVFILLSGFVIALLVDRKGEPYGPYLARRAFRIFPLYLVVLAASTLLLPLAVEAWHTTPFATPANANRLELARLGQEHLPSHLLAHLPLLQGLIPPSLLPGAPWTLVGQAWSVSLEWQFYVVAPLMIWGLASPRRALPTIALMIVATLSSRWFTPAYVGACIWHFGIGIATYGFVTRPASRRFNSALIAFFALPILYRHGLWQLVPLGIWAAVIGGIVAPASPLRALADRLGGPMAVRLGELSYSVYLIHMIPLTLAVFALNRLHLNPGVYAGLLLVTVLPATWLLSLASHRWIEKPGIRWGARFTERFAARPVIAPRPAV